MRWLKANFCTKVVTMTVTSTSLMRGFASD